MLGHSPQWRVACYAPTPGVAARQHAMLGHRQAAEQVMRADAAQRAAEQVMRADAADTDRASVGGDCEG
ncbi:hypothetical protein T484DRAFT_1765091 [Baffinella frigidus]|nr:hypothetical protein T484DRAFT_1765091 [Cryptophyta sp. CCMP2293]